jgi:hypothetical protein
MVASLFDMGVCDDEAVQGSDNKGREIGSLGLVEEMLLSSKEHQTSFEQLTERQKQYVLAYMRTGSPTAVAKELSLTGSPKGVGRRLSQIAKAMGLEGIKDLRPSGKGCQSATPSQLMETLKRQKFRCALSGVKLSPETAQLDHIEPLSDGGSNDASNLQWLDARVNKAKNTMSQAEFVRMCVEVAIHAGKLSAPPRGI